jgi:hypothetical protein
VPEKPARPRPGGRPKARERRERIAAGDAVDALTPAAQGAICDALRLGSTFETAAACAGAYGPTAREWLRLGTNEERKTPEKRRPDRASFVDFARAVRRAMAEWEHSAVREWNASPDWRAKESMLERRRPKEWSKRINVTIEEELDATLEALQAGLTDREFAKVVAVIAAARAERDTEQL